MNGMTRTILTTLAIGVASVAQAQTQATTISGRVTDAGAGVPVAGVQVLVVGTNVGAVSGEDGRYTIRAAPSGAVVLRALRIGYQEQRQTVNVGAGEQATADFSIRAAPINLSPVVTTATGQTRREEVGHTTQSVDAAAIVSNGPVANMTDLLTARAPGVQVLNSTSTGGGARVRIRGTSSLSLNNEPIYIIDGVRMTSNVNSIAGNIFTGGAAPSRVGDLNPEEIENVEVVPGPSASTLYGTDAANGVIVITTKRGRAGRTRLNAYVERGLISDFADYPTAYSIVGIDTVGPVSARTARLCTLPEVATRFANSARQCGVADTAMAFNLFEDERTTPIGTGERGQYGLQLSGGSEAVRFFSSAEFEEEIGIFKLPDVDLDRARDRNLDLRPEWKRPSGLRRVSTRANLNATLSPKAELAVQGGFIRSTTRFAQTDNNALGLFSNAFGGVGFPDATSTAFPATSTSVPGGFPSLQLYGYRAYRPLEMFQNTTEQDINRLIGSTTLTYRPFTWLSGNGVFGADVTNRKDTQLCRRANCPPLGTTRLGFRTDNRAWFYNYTANLALAASFQPMEGLGSKTTVGTQYVNYRFDGNGTYAEQLAPGTSTVSAGAVLSASDFTTGSKTLGAFVEQSLSWEERVYLTAAIRTDQNSAFGTEFQAVYYPKVNAAWVISRETFFPQFAWLSSLRLRGAYGASGTQPGPNDALRFLSPNSVTLEAGATAISDQPGVQLNTLGNPNLRPERSTEAEAGFDLRLFEERVSLEATYYNKLSRDALISEVIPPSAGTGATTRLANLGAVKNLGIENTLRAVILDRPAVRWDLGLSYNWLRNRLESTGPVPFPPGTIIRNVVGRPLNSYFGQKIVRYDDLDRNGILTVNEVVVDTANTYIGPSQPTRESVLTNTFELFDRMLTVNALFDYKGGYVVRNGTERIRCQNRVNCEGVAAPRASLFEQARAVALNNHPARTSAGYNENVNFARFRELSFTFRPRPEWSTRFLRSETASLTLGIRNIRVWTNYTGLDPESNYGQDNVQNDFQTLPPPTYFTLRLNVGF